MMIRVVVPTLNELTCLGPCLEAIVAGRPDEVVVVDGGSTDGTDTVARRYRVVARKRYVNLEVLDAPRGRASQMNAGARHRWSDGDAGDDVIFVFCHADTILPEGWTEHVRAVMADPKTTVGAFEFRLPGASPAYRLVEQGVALRGRFLNGPYGDQALFCRKADFDVVGPFPEPPVLEDIGLVRALKSRGRCVIVDAPVLVNDRAWRENGVFRQTWRNWSRALAEARRRPRTTSADTKAADTALPDR
ncbi:glycosyltransferase family 2 protein [bacterium]|nr:glycosyltransferase family 2 protein [bacterium]